MSYTKDATIARGQAIADAIVDEFFNNDYRLKELEIAIQTIAPDPDSYIELYAFLLDKYETYNYRVDSLMWHYICEG